MLPIGIALLVVAAVIVVGRRVEALGTVGLISIGVLAALWAGAVALEHTGWHDTDGWVDCHGYCNGWHHLGAVLFLTPLLAGASLALVLAGVVVARLAHRNTGRKRR